MGILRRLFGRKYTSFEESFDQSEAPSEWDTEAAGDGFCTGTATVVVYDLENLKHRLDDDVDWWADPEVEIAELRQRNLLMTGLGSDGFYNLDIVEDEKISPNYSLRFPSGKIFGDYVFDKPA